MWLSLTEGDNEPVIVNLDRFDLIRPDGEANGSIISRMAVDGGRDQVVRVNESPRIINERMINARAAGRR